MTTNSYHADPIAPNLLARQFDVHGVAINQVWVGDITYIPTREGFLSLATVLDLGSRRCVGWSMRDTMAVDLVTSALRMARESRHPAPSLIFHADRGRQDASEAYRTERTAHGMLASEAEARGGFGNGQHDDGPDGHLGDRSCRVITTRPPPRRRGHGV